MGVSPAGPLGFFPSWPVACDPTGLPFPWEEGEVEAETTDGEGSEILPEVVASMVEALGGRAEADCSGDPLLAGASWVEAPLRVHSEWWCSRW